MVPSAFFFFCLSCLYCSLYNLKRTLKEKASCHTKGPPTEKRVEVGDSQPSRRNPLKTTTNRTGLINQV